MHRLLRRVQPLHPFVAAADLCGRGSQTVATERKTDGSRHGPRKRAGLPSVVAPGGIEPPHADSKSAALSTELRGLGVRVDEVRRSLSAGRGEKVVDENPGHRLAGVRGRAADVRREDDVRKVDQRRRDRGLVHEHI